MSAIKKARLEAWLRTVEDANYFPLKCDPLEGLMSPNFSIASENVLNYVPNSVSGRLKK